MIGLFFSDRKKYITLKTKNIKPNKYAFSENIEKITFRSDVRNVSCAAFLGCRNLRSVTFCDGVRELGERAFANCVSLIELTLPQSLEVLGEYVFKDCISFTEVKLPDSIEYLPKGTFRNCTSLKRVVLPKSLKVIGEECFEGCANLEEIVIFDDLVKVERNAFKRCLNLQRISFPESLEYIGDFVFSSCDKMEYVRLNNTPQFLGKQPFSRHICNELKASEMAYVSSFLVDGEEGTCPVVSVPDNINFLALGFAGVLSDFGAGNEKTCFCHILSMNKESVKVFIGEKYYSYNDDTDYLIENGEFNFQKYDSQFNRATEYEKPFIAAYRLVYSRSLTKESELMYKNALSGKEQDVAIFATERNEISVLSYVIEHCSLSSDFYTALYNIALINGNRNLLDIISINSKKTGIAETESLFGDLLNNKMKGF